MSFKKVVQSIVVMSSLGIMVGCSNEKNLTETAGTQTRETKLKEEGSASQPESKKNEVNLSETDKEKAEQGKSDYQKIIRIYHQFLKTEDQKVTDINKMAFLANQEFYTGLYYTEYDLDGNGKNELLISLKNNDGGYTLVDVYTSGDKTDPIRLTTEALDLSNIGERMVLVPLENGELLYAGSGSAFKQHFKLYQFDKEGTGLISKVESESFEELETQSNPLDLSKLEWQTVGEETAEKKDKINENAVVEINSEKLVQGDFSSLNGKWQNGLGKIMTISNEAVSFSDDSTGTLESSGNKNETGMCTLSIRFGMSGAIFIVAPKNVAFTDKEVMGETKVEQDKIVMTQAGSEKAESVYYRVD